MLSFRDLTFERRLIIIRGEIYFDPMLNWFMISLISSTFFGYYVGENFHVVTHKWRPIKVLIRK